MATFDINSDQFVKHTRKMERFRRKGLPYAIKDTLNELAFRSRTNIIKNADKTFTVRNAKFFSSRTNVIRVRGLDVNKMESKAGIFAKSNNRSEMPVFNLRQQEEGKSISIGNIPLDDARVSKSNNKIISSRNRLNKSPIKTKLKLGKGAQKNRYKQRLILAKVASNSKRLVVTPRSVYRISRYHYSKKNKRTEWKQVLLYNKAKSKTTKLEKRKFVKPAFESTIKDNEAIFRQKIQIQINKF